MSTFQRKDLDPYTFHRKDPYPRKTPKIREKDLVCHRCRRPNGRSTCQSSSDAHANPSRDSAFSEIVMADAVGLALGCVGLPLLMSLSSVPIRSAHVVVGRHVLVGCCVCSSMVHLRSVHYQCCSRGSIARTRTVAVRHCERVVPTRSFVRLVLRCLRHEAPFGAVCERVIVL